MKNWERKNEFSRDYNPENFKKKWLIRTTNKCKEYTQILFYCLNKGNFCCEAAIKLHICIHTNTIKEFFTLNKHNEECEGYSPSPELKGKVIELIKDGITKPWEIEKKLAANGLTTNREKIYSIKNYLNKWNNFNKNTTLLSLKDNIESILENSKQHLKEVDLTPIIISDVSSPSDFKIMMTNYRNLKRVSQASHFHLDATYKCITTGHIVIVVGFSDLKKSFNLVSLSIVCNESSNTYEWILRTVKNETEKLDLEFSPKSITADNAPQITQAIRNFNSTIIRLNCWYHTQKNIKDIFRLKSELNKKVLEDIFFIQLATSKKEFEQVLELFINKWRDFPELGEGIKKIVTCHFKKNNLWFEGACLHAPSTNNSLERFNRTIKERYLNRAAVGITEFISLSVEIIDDTSKNTNPVLEKPIYDDSTIMKESFNCNFKEVENINEKKIIIYYKDCNTDLEVDNYVEYARNGYTSLSDYKKAKENVAFLECSTEIKCWRDLVCSCYKYLKEKKCEHVFHFLKQIKRLDVIENIIIPLKTQRGRKKNKIIKGTALIK